MDEINIAEELTCIKLIIVIIDMARKVDYDAWVDAWFDELNAAFDALTSHCKHSGYLLLETMEFEDFAQFAFTHSSKYPPSM